MLPLKYEFGKFHQDGFRYFFLCHCGYKAKFREIKFWATIENDTHKFYFFCPYCKLKYHYQKD